MSPVKSNHRLTVSKTIYPSLEIEGRSGQLPFPVPSITLSPTISIPAPALVTTSSILPKANFSESKLSPSHTTNTDLPPPQRRDYPPSIMGSTDLFVPVGVEGAPTQIPSRGDHPVPRTGIVCDGAMDNSLLMTDPL